jgi:hypothetical protein
MQRNRLDNMIKNARRAMSEYGRTFPLEEQKEINGILRDAEDSLKLKTSRRSSCSFQRWKKQRAE